MTLYVYFCKSCLLFLYLVHLFSFDFVLKSTSTTKIYTSSHPLSHHATLPICIGTAMGSVTFTGSIIACAKLQGIMSGAPIVFKGQHLLNAALGLLLIL